MSLTRYRAWRFILPDLEDQEAYAGLTVSPHGRIGIVSEGDSVRQAILLLISTRPGERVMRPDYGCDLFRLAFTPNDDTTAGLAMHYVRQALNRWEPRIDVLRLDAERNKEHPSRLDLTLEYRLRATQLQDRLTFSVNLHYGGMH